jgi:xanthine/CO dehydrogenase XdhC/CoxF family maturation factor
MKDLQDIIALARSEVAALTAGRGAGVGADAGAGARVDGGVSAAAAPGAGVGDRTARAALATLVSVEGSSYRRPGASMLIAPDGRRAGGISGGCLERDVERHAREVLASGQPRVVVYDTQSEADLLVGTGLGCGGRLEILVEPIELTAEHSPTARWSSALERREALAELIIVSPTPAGAAASPASASSSASHDASAVRSNAPHADDSGGEAASAAAVAGTASGGTASAEAEATRAEAQAEAEADRHDAGAAAASARAAVLPQGWRLFLWSHAASGERAHSLLAQRVEPANGAAADAQTARRDLEATIARCVDIARDALIGGRSTGVTIDSPRGPLQAFVRVVTPPVQLIVCGAGDDTMPLVRMAGTLGWYVRMLDHRAAFGTRERFPDAAQVDIVAAGELPTNVRLDARTVAVVMNHNFAADSAWLRALAPLPLAYVGVLGARTRTERLMRETELDQQPASALKHVFAPAGLDIGAEGADQIALAIVSEIQAVLTARPGASLRDRDRHRGRDSSRADASPSASRVLASETSEVM